MTFTTIFVGLIASCIAWSSPCMAKQYAERPITIIVPFGPGGISDKPARILAKVLEQNLSRPVVIDNKLGAGGIVAAPIAAAAEPDGYTFYYGTAGTLSIAPLIHTHLSHEPLDLFIPVHGLFEAMMANNSAEASVLPHTPTISQQQVCCRFRNAGQSSSRLTSGARQPSIKSSSATTA